jgi:hypothetical protein
MPYVEVEYMRKKFFILFLVLVLFFGVDFSFVPIASADGAMAKCRRDEFDRRHESLERLLYATVRQISDNEKRQAEALEDIERHLGKLVELLKDNRGKVMK